MKLLLDTHVVTWIRYDPERLSKTARQAILDVPTIAVSVVSGWEYGLNRSKHPGSLPLSFEELLSGMNITRLDLPFACHTYAEALPPIHADPFDRMLIAQALFGDWRLVTADDKIRRYPLDTLWD